MSRFIHHRLHFCINLVRLCLRAVAHQADGRFTVIKRCGGFGKGICHSEKVIIRVEKGDAHGNRLKSIGILRQLIRQVIIFIAGHKVGWLYHQRLNAVFYRTVQRLGDIVDPLTVTLKDMVDDDLTGEGPAHTEVREGLLQGVFDRADGQTAVIIVAGAEADHQKLLLSDFILITGIIESGVTGFIVFIVLSKRLCVKGGEPGIERCRKGAHQKNSEQFFHFCLLF